jgi:hypothetical protein
MARSSEVLFENDGRDSMTAVAELIQPNASEVRWARRLGSWDEHLIVGVDNALARGVSLEDLGLSAEEVHAARVRYLKYALATHLFEKSDRHLRSSRGLAYLKIGEVELQEVSEHPEHQKVLESYLGMQDWDDTQNRSQLEVVRRACEQSQP